MGEKMKEFRNNYLMHVISKLESVECDKAGLHISYNTVMAVLTDVFADIRRLNGKVFFIGNGGSAGISMHMTTDFLKNGRVRTHSMHDPATLTCLANDYGYENVFSKQLEMAAEEGDMLVAISSSGRSENILRAVHVARNMGCHIVTFSGFAVDNPLRKLGDFNVYVPCDSYGIVESIHQLILQQIVDELMERKN
ncbi:SIS domain-containing protein [Selenomonas ruminantium]|uniref:SIS domain-containing protein n=1 Tax=Selenomonas ruminantium TaxID=971 RepID=UPI0026F14885|nr:SIS domain-containing protein [Selenomonas ruminantium]